MIPVLFAPKAREYNNNGFGVLVDVGYCTVTEEVNGEFELELQYPINGSHYSDLAVDCQILAKPNETSDQQAFRIYNISKPMNGVVTVSAEHISYELSSIIVNPFSASNVGEALSKIKSNSIGENPFEFWTDKDTVANMSHDIPLSARSLLGGVNGSVLDTYTGEYEFDNYTVKLHQNRGEDNGVVVSYAKNLTGVKCEERSDGVVTGVIGYWTSEDESGNVETVIGDLQSVETELSYSRNVVVDFSGEYENKPTKAQINSSSEKYLNSHKNVPYFSVSVEFVNLGDTEEYKQYKGLNRVKLCDIVTVKNPLYGINVKAKVVKTVFDSVREKYDKIEIGEVAAKISQTIVAQEKAISQKVTLSQLDKAILNATNAITGNKGGYVVLNPSTAPQELLILDKPNINEAVNVWRWNLAGLGHSSTGYNGDFTTAITADGQIVADFITTGTLNTNLITVKNLSADSIVSGSLTSKNGFSNFSLDTGTARFGGEDYYTDISSGKISQYLKVANKIVGGIIPVGTETKFWQGLFYNGTANNVSGAGVYRDNGDNYSSVCEFSLNDSCLKTNAANEDVPYGITHFRKSTFNGVQSIEQLNVGISKTRENNIACICLEQGEGGNATAKARLDIYKSTGEALITIVGCSLGDYSKKLELGKENLWWGGSLYASGSIGAVGDITTGGSLYASGSIGAVGDITTGSSLYASGSIGAVGDINTDGSVLARSIGNSNSVVHINGSRIDNTSKSHFNVSANTICLGSPNTIADGYKVLVSGNMYVDGNVFATGDISGATITNRSDRKIKKNIKSTETKNALSAINSLNIYDYDLKDNGKSVKMGLMADEAPQEILSVDGKGINLYSYCGMLALAVKELSEKVDMIFENGGNNGRKN